MMFVSSQQCNVIADRQDPPPPSQSKKASRVLRAVALWRDSAAANDGLESRLKIYTSLESYFLQN